MQNEISDFDLKVINAKTIKFTKIKNERRNNGWRCYSRRDFKTEY